MGKCAPSDSAFLDKFVQECCKAKTILLKRGRRLYFFLYFVFPFQSYFMEYMSTVVFLPPNTFMREKNGWLKRLGDDYRFHSIHTHSLLCPS